MRLSDGRTLAVEVPGRWVSKDRSGETCFKPDGVRFLDKLRSLFSPMDQPPSPGFLRTLRQALGLTQQEFGRRVGVDKLTVSRWERGELRPGTKSLNVIRSLRTRAMSKGVTLAG